MNSHKQAIDAAVAAVSTVLLGKSQPIRLALCCLLARGHLLIEDLPGMGKTTLAHALARVLGLSYNRVQFTSDLLPADILGVAVYQREDNSFLFHPGPVFTQVLLADEINRTTPRTQSALLEAMAEGQVSIEGETRPLPTPFFVIATQNPSEQSGTYALPESQLDRFLMRIELGYPDPGAERDLMRRGDLGGQAASLEQVMSVEQLGAIRDQVEAVHTSEALLDYLQRLVARTRAGGDVSVGLSPRGVLALLRAAKTWALMDDRDHVLPEDLQAVLGPVAGHRLVPGERFAGDGMALVAMLQQDVPVLAS
ncbi:MoxR-like ATPase [Chromatocurvus halotolerans]|uniref:MoxR-like ATPase n=1 Tax=Chromatocurvus halotolerans TaxID=1132028 RepID=A0A4R2KNE4_9GAMM|nr:AAA family ATPase [Chromatocurvus halotolerans]TCO75681.1 MoxR-like ATPase [Chromatocurvus halotolerans]